MLKRTALCFYHQLLPCSNTQLYIYVDNQCALLLPAGPQLTFLIRPWYNSALDYLTVAVAATGPSLLFLHKSCGMGEATFYTCLAVILSFWLTYVAEQRIITAPWLQSLFWTKLEA